MTREKSGTHFQSSWPLLKKVLLENIGEKKKVERTDHAKKQMVKRNINVEDVIEVIKFWAIDEMYDKFTYPYGKDTAYKNQDPVFSLTGQDSRGRKLTIAFALKRKGRKLDFKVVTTYFEDELRKNRHKANLDHESF